MQAEHKQATDTMKKLGQKNMEKVIQERIASEKKMNWVIILITFKSVYTMYFNQI